MAFDNLDTTANMENIIADKRQPSWISFLLVAIIVALLSAIGYVIWNNNKIKDIIQQKENAYAEVLVEKDTLQSLLDEATMRYDLLKTINVKRDSTISLQEREITKIRTLIQSLLLTVKADHAEHDELKKLIAQLNTNIENYKTQIETVNAQNLQLIEQKSMAAATAAAEEKIKAAQQASTVKDTAVEKANTKGIGSSLYATNFKNSGFEENKKGKLKKTHSARNIDLMRISFDLEENNTINSGSKDLYVVVMDPDGIPLAVEALGSGKFIGKDGKEKAYTHKLVIDYNQGQHQNVSFDWRQDQKFQYGKYKIEVYNNAFKIGEGICNFKKSGVFD
jgi:hypothetical protein